MYIPYLVLCISYFTVLCLTLTAGKCIYRTFHVLWFRDHGRLYQIGKRPVIEQQLLIWHARGVEELLSLVATLLQSTIGFKNSEGSFHANCIPKGLPELNNMIPHMDDGKMKLR